ncbi:MAG: type ISP restriction/modification enzyme [Pikeienuella sp.]|uniref:type ISP restriction/modification enzyme n=1 Tax=Pikeienuella sp. TaxID=2831957 RepID=UPI00391DC529
MTIISDFVANVQTAYRSGQATEHSYRPALQTLFNALAPNVAALNEPRRVQCGAPDFLIQRGDIVIGHAEAKDVGLDIRKMRDANRDQQQRYLKGLPNLIYTNCLDWDFYREGERVASVTIGDYLMGIQPRPDQFAALESLLRNFIAQTPQTITSPRELAERMAGKAALIKDVLRNALKADSDLRTELAGQYQAFREHLIHDISVDDFADIYAETIAYGMFAARLHDTTLESFSRHEALELLPKSNPFLRSLFGYVAGADLDDRIRWIIDDLAKTFQAANVAAIMEGFGRLTGRHDPFLHFYETFLAAYDPKKRKARGVWYTPEPVVNFIVRAIDDVLKSEFGLADGLADTSKVTIDWDTGQKDAKGKPVVTRKEVHRVQILDPATGTGTFLAEVIKQIAPRIHDMAEGAWSGYVEKDLIPRLHGFELLMASYAMCHMKLDMILTEMGYRPTGSPPRLSVYLTNSLEEGEAANQTLPFARWLSDEVRQANAIKRDMPIMCVIGNPPYSGESANKGAWITKLMEDYKKEPGGRVKLKERNPKWINDDYVKFIRLAEHLIERNGEGVLGFITNHGWLDNPTFRGMRWRLMKVFDRIHVMDLHGNAKKKERAPDGGPDRNVFDIQQGVAIVIAVKRKPKKGTPIPSDLAEVQHADLWGEREGKYRALWDGTRGANWWQPLEPRAPHYMLVPRNYLLENSYNRGFALREFFRTSVLGFQTHRDGFAVAEGYDELAKRLADLRDVRITDSEIARVYGIADNRDWSVSSARKKAMELLDEELIQRCAYRPFDVRHCILSEAAMDYPRLDFNRNLVGRSNICLSIPRQLAFTGYHHAIVSNLPSESCFISNKTQEQNNNFLLYTFDDIDHSRRINFDPKLHARLKTLATDLDHGEPDEIAVFDYIYGVLHCPAYRETFADFLKKDFPRIAWPASPAEFWDISAKGARLRRLHLMEPDAIGETPYPFRGEGDATVEKPEFRDGAVWINRTQHFANAPGIAWGFFIGGYQPAQKWLKDRKGRALGYDDIRHYQRILKILAETDRIMKTIAMTLPGAPAT